MANKSHGTSFELLCGLVLVDHKLRVAIQKVKSVDRSENQ